MRMPKKNEHGDVFLRVRIYEKCSSHNRKTIKQHSKQTNTPRAIPSVIIILQTNTMTSREISDSGNLIANFPLYSHGITYN
jgi:arginine deiminase